MTIPLTAASILLFCALNTPIKAETVPTVVRVSAASSLTDALKEINVEFETATGVKVELNTAASSVLARQIQEGAPVDVFLSADLAKMESLRKAGLIDEATVENQLGNALVVIAPTDSSLALSGIDELAGDSVSKIATGDPKAVPVGVYTKDYLTAIGLWDKISPKIVPTDNVRSALAAVESGNVDAGFVYKTDAAISSQVKVIFEVPTADAPPIVYPMARIKDAAHRETAAQYLEFLDTDTAHRIFAKHGFLVLPEPDSAAEKEPK